MTLAGAGVAIGAAGNGDELPFEGGGVQRQSQDTPFAAACFAVRPRDADRRQPRTPRADHELADAAGLIGAAVRILRSKPLVTVVMAGQDDVRACIVKSAEQRAR